MDEANDRDGSEMIDKDGKEKAGTTFLCGHHVSRRLSYVFIYTVRGSTLHMRIHIPYLLMYVFL